jgi:D-alanine-D-alanine ligase
MAQRVVVLYGGNSPERKVSLVSGAEIGKQLKLNGYQVIEIDPADYQYGHELIRVIHSEKPDVVFIGLHGGEGENGVLQAMLDGSKIPYTGSGFKTSAVAMDKLLSKLIAEQAMVLTPGYYVITEEDFNSNSYPDYYECKKIVCEGSENHELVIKPIDAGSSVGVHIITDSNNLVIALTDALQYSDRVLVEEFIEGRELTVTILDGKALPVVEIIPHDGFYDYPNKYTAGNTTYQTPAKLTDAETIMVQTLALKIWHAMECSGYARIDFRFNGNDFYFLEVNTLPGMTPLSLTPMAAKATGMSFGDLLDKIISVVPKY